MTRLKTTATVLLHGRRESAHIGVILRRGLGRTEPGATRFVIFGRGRTGSSMLVGLLNGVPGVHCDDEILHASTLFPRAYVRARAASAGSETYGCKILSYQLTAIQPLRRPEDFLRRLSDDGFQVIYLSRSNLVQHAVSNLRARQYGFHQQGRAASSVGSKLVVDPVELLSWIRKSEDLATFEAAALAGLPHLALTYEHDLVVTAQHDDTLRRVCEFLELPANGRTAVASAYHKVSPVALSDSIENYAEVARHLEGTPYARYL